MRSITKSKAIRAKKRGGGSVFAGAMGAFLAFSLISCAFLEKAKDKIENKNQIVGEGSDEITSPDIDRDGRGSDSGAISGLSSVYFALDSSSLSQEARDTLAANKAWFDENTQVQRIELEGHCDPLGSEAYNIGLGSRRARAVMDYLKSIGVSGDRLSIISYGEERLLSETDDSLNRRVNFVPIY